MLFYSRRVKYLSSSFKFHSGSMNINLVKVLYLQLRKRGREVWQICFHFRDPKRWMFAVRRVLAERYLRGKVPNCPIAFEFGLCAEGRPHLVIKNPKRITALRPSVQSYRHFTGILAYSMVFTNKSNENISAWDFAHKQV
jgi:hypothetical protein